MPNPPMTDIAITDLPLTSEDIAQLNIQEAKRLDVAANPQTFYELDLKSNVAVHIPQIRVIQNKIENTKIDIVAIGAVGNRLYSFADVIVLREVRDVVLISTGKPMVLTIDGE